MEQSSETYTAECFICGMAGAGRILIGANYVCAGKCEDRQLMDAVLDQAASAQITQVLHFIYNETEEAVNALFPTAVASYKEKWFRYDPFTFWCDLDDDNRVKLIVAAREFYAR